MTHDLLRAKHVEGEWFDVSESEARQAILSAIQMLDERPDAFEDIPGLPGRGRPPKDDDDRQVRVQITIAPDLLSDIDEAARTDGMSRSEFLRAGARDRLNKRR